jgi:hypothetical protein
MARRKKRRTTKRSGRCKVVSVCGKRRRICWGKKGITSNSPAGSGGRRRKKSGKKSKASRCRFGVVKSGKRKGQCLKRKRARK